MCKTKIDVAQVMLGESVLGGSIYKMPGILAGDYETEIRAFLYYREFLSLPCESDIFSDHITTQYNLILSKVRQEIQNIFDQFVEKPEL